MLDELNKNTETSEAQASATATVRPLDYRLPELMEYLRQKVKECEDLNMDMDEANWGMETGVIISGNDAKTLIEFYEQASS